MIDTTTLKLDDTTTLKDGSSRDTQLKLSLVSESRILKWKNGWHDPVHRHIAWSSFLPGPSHMGHFSPFKSQTLMVWQFQKALLRLSPMREVQVIVMIDEVPLVMDIAKVQDGPGFFRIIVE